MPYSVKCARGYLRPIRRSTDNTRDIKRLLQSHRFSAPRFDQVAGRSREDEGQRKCPPLIDDHGFALGPPAAVEIVRIGLVEPSAVGS